MAFRRPPKNRGQFNIRPHRRPYPRWLEQNGKEPFGYAQAMLATLGVSVGALVALAYINWGQGNTVSSALARTADVTCTSPRIIDGDTFDCAGHRIRLHGIDAPELPGHCRRGRDCTPGDPYASTENLRQLTAGAAVKCERVDTDIYGRTVARCYAGNLDLSCAQLEGDYAVKRYGYISC